MEAWDPSKVASHTGANNVQMFTSFFGINFMICLYFSHIMLMSHLIVTIYPFLYYLG